MTLRVRLLALVIVPLTLVLALVALVAFLGLRTQAFEARIRDAALAILRREPENPDRHLFSLLVGVALILLGAGVALASSVSYRRFVRSSPSQDVAAGYLVGLGSLINLVIAAAGIALALYLLAGAI